MVYLNNNKHIFLCVRKQEESKLHIDVTVNVNVICMQVAEEQKLNAQIKVP